MKVTAEHRYDADVDTVFALFSEPSFYERKFKAVGARRVEVTSFNADGANLSFTIRREMPANAPGVIKSIIGEWNTLTQTEDWGGDVGEEYWNEFRIDAENTPVTITGSMLLRGDGDGCVNEVEVNIRCPIPFLGGKVEQFVADDARQSLAREYEFIKGELG